MYFLITVVHIIPTITSYIEIISYVVYTRRDISYFIGQLYPH